jgi:hypothetical protein
MKRIHKRTIGVTIITALLVVIGIEVYRYDQPMKIESDLNWKTTPACSRMLSHTFQNY